MAKRGSIGSLIGALLRGIAKGAAAPAKPRPRYRNDGDFPVSATGKKIYPVGLVGESKYQEAIMRCRPGEPVTLLHEPGNPYDPRAIACESARGETIGYLPRDSWLHRSALDSKGRVAATIRSVEGGGSKSWGVVIAVTKEGDRLGTRVFRRG